MPRFKTLPAVAVLSVLVLSACAGRDASVVTVTQPTDYALSCEAIAIERVSITEQLESITKERQNNRAYNAAVGVGSVFFWPLLFALDLSSAEKQEIEALQKRDQHLVRIAEENRCNLETAELQN